MERGLVIGQGDAVLVRSPQGKPALIALAVLDFVTSLGIALAWDWISLLGFRFLGGVAVGGASVVSPLDIAEIEPAKYRGRLVAIQQCNVVLGILLGFLSNYMIARLHLGATEWRWMLGVLAAPSALFFLLLLPTPRARAGSSAGAARRKPVPC